MKISKLIKSALLFVFLAGTALAVTGCHTAEGFGRDMEDAGESIQREVR